MADILVVDDHEDFCHSLKSKIEMIGHDCRTALSCEDGFASLRDKSADIVFLDVVMPGRSGIQAISEFRELECRPEVIIVTASGDIDSAEQAIRNGALDYLLKPLNMEGLESTVRKSLRYREKRLKKNLDKDFDRQGIVGESIKIRNCLHALQSASNSPCSVLIRGETGTGKELFARALYINSVRADENFVVVDCTNLQRNLAESLLFGHSRGAFTGAHETRQGLVGQADGGVLFLDEIGDLDLEVQKSLLRVLQEKKFRPLSSKEEIHSDFRLITATNRDLEKMVAKGEFRKDLYYRISNMVIDLPSLRERPEDISLIADHYLKKIVAAMGKEDVRFSDNYYAGLQRYGWPGNVRELVNVIQYSVANADSGEELDAYHFPVSLRTFLATSAIPQEDSGNEAPEDRLFDEGGNLMQLKQARAGVVSGFERSYLKALIENSLGNVKKACALSGLSRTRLYELLQKHELKIR